MGRLGVYRGVVKGRRGNASLDARVRAWGGRAGERVQERLH